MEAMLFPIELGWLDASKIQASPIIPSALTDGTTTISPDNFSKLYAFGQGSVFFQPTKWDWAGMDTQRWITLIGCGMWLGAALDYSIALIAMMTRPWPRIFNDFFAV